MKKDTFLDAIISSCFGKMPSESYGFSNVTMCLLSTRLRPTHLRVWKVFAQRAKTFHTLKKKARLRAIQRRCRFIAHIADSSAFGAGSHIRIIYIICVKKHRLKAQVYCIVRCALVYLQYLKSKTSRELMHSEERRINHLFNVQKFVEVRQGRYHDD